MRAARVAILAGGLGSRMLPRTLSTPKLLLPVAGRPFASWLLERLDACGFERAVLCVGHLAAAVRAALGDRHGRVDLTYVEDGDRLLGTGGALARALPHLDATFLATYGDSYLPFDYAAPLADLDAHPEADATMTVYENAGSFDASNTAVAGERVARYAKGAADPALRYIDYGAIALRASAVRARGDGAWGLEALQTDLARRGSMRALVATERFYEIGSEAGLADLEAHLA